MDDSGLRWDDPSLSVPGEPAHRARYRLHQSWYREVQLSAGYGEYRGRPVGSLLSRGAVADDPAANFFDEATARYAETRALEVRREQGTLNGDRLRRNMLSSMPLCFNIFGALRRDVLSLGEVLRQAFDVPVHSIIDVLCEWAPPRADHLDDLTAFDAFVSFLDPVGKPCFLAIETKYTESFSPRVWDGAKYRELKAARKWLTSDASDVLSLKATNQLWRNLLLAASLEATDAYDHGWSIILTLQDDPHIASARATLQSVLKPDEDHVRWCTFERLAELARSLPALASWAEWFSLRYLPNS